MGILDSAAGLGRNIPRTSEFLKEGPREIGRLRQRVSELEEQVADLQETVKRIDFDLQESRMLNRRAADLLDIVADVLGHPEAAEAAKKGMTASGETSS